MTETPTIMATQTAVEAYEEQWATTVQAVRTLGRLGKWSSRIADDSNPEELRGVITIYGRHKRVRQAMEIVVTPTEVHTVLQGMKTEDDWTELDRTGPLKRGELLRIVRRVVNAWRHVQRLDSLSEVPA